MQICTECGKNKKWKAFSKSQFGEYSGICKICQRKIEEGWLSVTDKIEEINDKIK